MENIRASYGATAAGMNYDETTKDFFADIDGSIPGIMKNPLNHPLTSFAREFVQNEKNGVQIFNELNEKIQLFYDNIEKYPFYQDMKLTKLIDDVIKLQKLWAVNQRVSTILAKKKMEEIKKVNEEHYITKIEYDKMVQEYEASLDTSLKGMQAKVEVVGQEFLIRIPRLLQSQYDAGEIVLIRRIKRKA